MFNSYTGTQKSIYQQIFERFVERRGCYFRFEDICVCLETFDAILAHPNVLSAVVGDLPILTGYHLQFVIFVIAETFAFLLLVLSDVVVVPGQFALAKFDLGYLDPLVITSDYPELDVGYLYGGCDTLLRAEK
jgi:hypothetical protein